MNHKLLIGLVSTLSLTHLPYAQAEGAIPLKDISQLEKLDKIDSHLYRLERNPVLRMQATTPAGQAEKAAGLPSTDGYVTIDAIASGNTATLLADLEQLGLQQASVAGKMVSGLLPNHQIGELKTLASLQFARPAYAITNASSDAGSVVSQGDKAIRADIARSKFNVSGKGVKVGVLSDSYNCQGGALAGIASSDLPSPVTLLGEGDCATGVDEGRAMLEIVHDIAPQAALSFRTALQGQADMVNGIRELVANGTKVIVDDVLYLAEPMFQDGLVAQAIDQAKAQGVSYFTAAGNHGANSYQATFRPSGQFFSIYSSGTSELHDFDPGAGVDTCQQIKLPEGGLFLMVMQWDQPFYSVSGGAGAQNELDVLLMDENCHDTIHDYSINLNVGRDPVEIIDYKNPSGSGKTRFGLSILHFDKTGQRTPYAGLVKTVSFFAGQFAEYATQSSSSYGHQNTAGGMAVGAVYYQKTPAFGLTPALAEPFSSVGGTPIIFDKTGKRLSSQEIRKQPAITAPDGVDTTFFIPGMDSNANGKPDFYGTSAAAPHAAGAAALLYEAHPTLTPEQLYQALTNSAQDMDNPHTPMFDRGFDALTGYGWMQVDAAIQSIPTQLPPTQPTQNVMCNGKKATIIGTSRAEVLNGTKGDDVIAGLGGNDQIFGMEGNDTICGGDGFDLISGGSGLDTCDSERTTKCEYRARQ